MDINEILNKIYYKEKNYDGVENLYKKAKVYNTSIKKNDVKEWLNKQYNKQVTTAITGKKEFKPIYSETPYSFQLDLTFFPRYKSQNKNNYVLFTAININTRFAYAYYSKDKETQTILNMLKEMESKTVINTITCDEGSEFTNKEFVKYCLEKNIELFFVKNDSHKMGIINRFHRTLKDKLKKHFITNDSYNWIDDIDKIIFNYNHTVNSGIGIEPYKIDAGLEHEIIVFKRNISDLIDKKHEDKFIVGDNVRILNKKVVFQDKLLPNYSNKVYVIVRVLKNSCIVKMGDEEIRIKKDQLIKSNIVDNDNDNSNMEKIQKSEEIKNKIKREKLESVVIERAKREKKPNSRYL